MCFGRGLLKILWPRRKGAKKYNSGHMLSRAVKCHTQKLLHGENTDTTDDLVLPSNCPEKMSVWNEFSLRKDIGSGKNCIVIFEYMNMNMTEHI